MLSRGLRAQVVGTGPDTVVQGPGWGPAVEYLRQSLVPLLTGFRVLTYDVRNTGEAPRSPAPGSQRTEVLVGDLAATATAHGFESFVLAGHSHGAFIAMGFAVRFPERVRALVLLTPSLQGRGAADSEELLARYAQDPRRSEAVAWYRRHPRVPEQIASDRELARWIRRTMPLNFHDLEAMARFQARLIHGAMPSADALQGMPSRPENWVAEGLGDLTVPTLVVVGRHDVATPMAHGVQVQEMIPGAELAIMDNSGHHPWVEEPGPFTTAMRGFLGRHGIRPAPGA